MHDVVTSEKLMVCFGQAPCSDCCICNHPNMLGWIADLSL